MAALKSELLLELTVLALATGLWLVAAPAALCSGLSPAELIEDALPKNITIARASKADLVSAVCAVVRKDRASGADLTSVAVAAHGELAGNIVETVLRCAGKVDCEYAGAIVEAAVAARPGVAKEISEAAIARTPKCEDTIKAAVRKQDDRAKTSSLSPVEPVPVTGTSASLDEAFDPRERLVLVCDAGVPRAVRQSQLDDFFRSHPDAMVGPCPRIPSPSPVSSPASSPTVAPP
jgi:hypothetical protein